MGGLVRGRLLIWGDAMCLRARIRSFKPPELHFLSFYHNLEVDKDCLVTQLCLFCIVTSLKILASYTLLLLLMYSCKFQLRNSIFIILYTITCALNDQSCRCAIKQHSFIHSFYAPLRRRGGILLCTCRSVRRPHFCPEHNSKSISGNILKLYRWIDLIKEKCSVQEPLLCPSYFWRYCPLLIFILNFCPDHISNSISVIILKLNMWIDLIKEKCSAQVP